MRGFPEQTPDPILHMSSILLFGVYIVFSGLEGTRSALTIDVPKYRGSEGKKHDRSVRKMGSLEMYVVSREARSEG